MIISTRLSLSFSAIASSIFILFGVSVYLFSSNYRKNDFQTRLEERVVITEKMFLEKESFSSEEFNKISNEFQHFLPKETEEILEIMGTGSSQFEYEYPDNVKEGILTSTSFSFQASNVQGMSKVFHVKGKNFIVIVTAVDEIGLHNLSYLRKLIFISFIIGIPLIFLGGFIISKRALSPLSNKIAHANAISATNLHQRLKVYNPKDEIGKLAIAFNNLLDRLEASFDAQKAFISNASHEIKNPLTALIGEAEVALSKTRSEEEYIESLSNMLAEAESLNVTTNNLLQLSKVTANAQNVDLEIINLPSFLEQVKESFDFLNADNKVVLEPNVDTDQVPIEIMGNKELLKTAITNLFDNACKFSSNNTVIVSISKQSGTVLIKITDQGIGIHKNDLEKVEIPFHRGNNAIQIAGSGIGLALSSRIIKLHKGSLNIQSQLDVGTAVSVEFPLFLS
jgi:signal transduction histidine kinase